MRLHQALNLATVQVEHKQAFEATIASLRYGAVHVNCCTIAGFAIPKLSWGAFPGNQPHVRPVTNELHSCPVYALTTPGWLSEGQQLRHLLHTMLCCLALTVP